MKKFIYFVFFIGLASSFVACGGDDGESAVKTIKSVNILAFKAYKGTPNGGEEIQFNNLKKIDLVSTYFTNSAIRAHSDKSIEFYQDKVTYIYVDSTIVNYPTKKIVSEYEFKDNSLFIIKSDKSSFFAAEGDSQDNLYRTKSFVLYPSAKTKNDTINSFNILVDSIKPLELGGYKIDGKPDLRALTNPKEIIIWCNILYYFE